LGIRSKLKLFEKKKKEKKNLKKGVVYCCCCCCCLLLLSPGGCGGQAVRVPLHPGEGERHVAGGAGQRAKSSQRHLRSTPSQTRRLIKTDAEIDQASQTSKFPFSASLN
jgi:hypothetical protein